MKNDFRKENFWEKELDAFGKCRIGTNYSANQFQMPGNNEMIHSTSCNKPQYIQQTQQKESWYYSLPQRGFFFLKMDV